MKQNIPEYRMLSANGPIMNANFSDLVEPRLGNICGRWISFSSACRPFGMVNLSPDTRVDGDWRCGYNLSESQILGFSHVHDWQIGGILVMPVISTPDVAAGVTAWQSPFSRSTEICKPGYHRLRLDRSDVVVELTSSLRVGVHRYQFPSHAELRAVVIDLQTTCGPCSMGESSLVQIDARRFEGHVINLPTRRRPKPLTIYFSIEVDTDARLVRPHADVARALIEFDPRVSTVTMKVGISYTSTAAAWDNLRAEAAGKDFDQLRDESRDEWNDLLGRIRVEGGTPEQRGRFYTDLYTSLLGRRTASDHAGTYIDNSGAKPRVRQIPLDAEGRPRYRHYNSDAWWGAQWSIIPLWLLVYPELIDGFCRCFFDMYQNGGLIPRGPSGGLDTFVMTSAQTTPLFTSAMINGVYQPENPIDVFDALVKNHSPGGLMSKCGYEHHTFVGGGIEDYLALGYIPEGLPAAGFHNNGAAQTVEHAFNDWHLARLAERLGFNDHAQAFDRRSSNWRNLFDPCVGFLRPRERDGSWREPYSPWDRAGWTEANAWTYTFHAPHDIEGLDTCFGSRSVWIERLEEAFRLTRELGYFVAHEDHQKIPLDFGNEPALAAAHLFHLAGRPDRATHWVREVHRRLKSGNAPTDSYGGDEDQGIMAAWNVLVSIGLFSAKSVTDGLYQITTPVFDRITVALNPRYAPGQSLTIIAQGNDPHTTRFIRSAAWNGTPLDTHSVSYAQLVRGGVLELLLTADAQSK
jgi:predicted alpha-1,2-mannosidase